MVTPEQAMDIAAADMNDSAQTNYTDAALLPYLNMALEELLQRLEENNVPITEVVMSPTITVPAGTTEISFTSTPALPTGLIEVQNLWESDDGGNTWTPVARVEFINPNIATNQNITTFGIYTWNSNMITVPESNADIMLYMKYIKKIITLPILIADIAVPLPVDARLFLGHKTASLCAMLIGQDAERAGALADLSEQAIEREINIPTKGKQKIATRRRPFRAAYKTYARSW